MLFESPPANFMLCPVYEENLLVTLARTVFRLLALVLQNTSLARK